MIFENCFDSQSFEEVKMSRRVVPSDGGAIAAMYFDKDWIVTSSHRNVISVCVCFLMLFCSPLHSLLFSF